MIAIVGRPNVGKSTLFNALAGHRISIVEPTAGVTRDRVTAEITIDGHRVELVDTGGMGVVDDDTLSAHVAKQIELALGLANIIVFVVDIRTGLAPLDILVGKCLRKLQKPLLLVANKADHAQLEAEAGEFHKLGFGEPMRISAQHQRGVTTVKERLEELLSANDRPEGDAPEVIKVAVVGKRNAGKSTFVNKLLGEERMIVSDVAGTTRDAVDCPFTLGGREFVAIDTAGLRRQRKVENAIEHFSLQRSHEAIERADVVIFMFDVTETISIVDKNLARVISDLHKPCVLVCNKWDLARERIDTGEFDGYVQKQLPELKYCPAVFICALENRGVRQALRTAEELYDQAGIRVATGTLNRIVTESMIKVRPRIKKTRPRLYFATQSSVHPPTIVLMVNKPKLFGVSYRRYLLNRLREHTPLAEVPIKLIFRERLSQYNAAERKEREKKQRKRAKRDG